jgi:hypothetical protein
MLKFIEGKAPLVVKKRRIGKEAAGAYFVIKGLIVDIVDSEWGVVEYLVTRILMPNTNDPRDVKSDTTIYSEEKFIALVSEFGNLFADYKKCGEEYRLRYTEFPVYCRDEGLIRTPKLLACGEERFLALMAGDYILYANNEGELMSGSADNILNAGISIAEMLVGSLGNRSDSRYFEFVRDYRESEEYKIESARGRLVGDSCCHLVPSAEQFSISYTARINGVSNTGVCNVPSLATLFYCFNDAIEDSGIKVISFERCLGLRDIAMRADRDKDSLTVVMPRKSLFGAPKVSIEAKCKEFRLDGNCKRIELTLVNLEHLDIDSKSLSDAKQVDFVSCKGLKSLTFNRASRVALYDTDTEELFCHVPLGVNGNQRGVKMERCNALKTVKLSSDKFKASAFGEVFRECNNLEELSIETDSLVLDGKVTCEGRCGWRIDLCEISKKLKRFSLTLTSRFSIEKAILGGEMGVVGCDIIAPSGAEVKLEGSGVDLSKYFTVKYQ